ncbi:MAG: alpha/beta fold hydrolase [Acidobacteriota bacterium]|nr:alpha/beta fold hydrolase [Blastocatellia bacterium]MDW8241378.1 alpha/beta fold hydrolase [Acidobacteriota bacterium]
MRHTGFAQSIIRAVVILFCLSSVAVAQTTDATRRDLAVKLIALDAAWERARDSEEARARAVPTITQAVTNFFRNRFAETCSSVAQAIFRLEQEGTPSPERQLADALVIRGPRLLDPTQEAIPRWTLHTAYSTPRARQPLEARWSLLQQDRVVATGVIAPLNVPADFTMPTGGLGQGEYEIELHIVEGATVHRQWREPLSLVPHAAARLRSLEAQLASFQKQVADFEWQSVRHWLQIVSETLAGATPETNYPIGRLLAQAEHAVAQWQQGGRWWQNQPGDHWVSARVNDTIHYFRLFVPATMLSGPRPLVIALHGAGGNEHLFFEGYGLGRVLTEAATRGWYVLAPRAGSQLDHVWAALELAYAHLNVDRSRVLLIGHSMGGFQTFAAALQNPTAFAGIAVYAAGSDASLAPLKDKPVFLAVGAQELALLRATVRNTRDAFNRLEPCCFQYKEYAPCEHLMIVREALPDSLAFLESKIQ